MILTREQINRYLRHILIQEISGPDQKKITETRIFILAPNIKDASSLIYYLAALGAGHISCSFNDNNGYEKLFRNVHDLNGNVIVELADYESWIKGSSPFNGEGFALRILLCRYEKLKDNLIKFTGSWNNSEFISTVIAVNKEWKGFIQTFSRSENLDCFFSNLQPYSGEYLNDTVQEESGSLLSNCFLGTIASIECVKLCLNLYIMH